MLVGSGNLKQFNFLNDAKSILDALASKDKNYQSLIEKTLKYCGQIETLFSVFETDYHAATIDGQKKQSDAYKTYIDASKKLTELTNEQNQVLKSKILEINRKNKLAYGQEKQTLHLSLNDIEHQIELENQKHQDRLLHVKNDHARELKVIEQEIVRIKKDHSQSMQILEQTHQSALSQIERTYQEQAPIIKDTLSEQKQTIEAQIAEILVQKENYRKQCDDNYLSIKNVYHQSSTSFNKKIDVLKNKKKRALDELQQLYRHNLIPIENRLKALQEQYQQIKVQTQQDLTKELKEHNTLLDTLNEAYELEKNKINRESADAISLLNSKLTAYKESLYKKRMDDNKQLKEFSTTHTEAEQLILKKQLNTKTRSQDLELNKQIIRTQQDSHLKQKEHYKRLFVLEEKHVNNRKKWRIRRAILDFEYKQSLANMELNYQHRLQEIELALRREKLTLDYQTKLLDLSHLSEIDPLDTQLSIWFKNVKSVY